MKLGFEKSVHTFAYSSAKVMFARKWQFYFFQQTASLCTRLHIDNVRVVDGNIKQAEIQNYVKLG